LSSAVNVITLCPVLHDAPRTRNKGSAMDDTRIFARADVDEVEAAIGALSIKCFGLSRQLGRLWHDPPKADGVGC
jgi:hypothetical protein